MLTKEQAQNYAYYTYHTYLVCVQPKDNITEYMKENCGNNYSQGLYYSDDVVPAVQVQSEPQFATKQSSLTS